MDLSHFFVFELYYTREFMLKVLIQIQKTFKTIIFHLILIQICIFATYNTLLKIFHLILFYDCQCLVYKQISYVHVLRRSQ